MACTMAIQTVRPSATSKPRRVVKRRPSLSGAHRNGLSNSLRNSIGNSTYSLGGSTHSSSDYDASDSSGFPTVDDILMDDFEREGEGARRSSPPPPPRPSRPLRRLPMGNHEQPQSQPQPQMPRRRSSMDSIDASPRLQQRRRSSLDGMPSSMSSAGGMASLRHGGGGNPIFRPPTLDHASQEPLDAALGGGSQHSLGGIPAGSAAVDSGAGGSAPSRSALSIRRTSMSDLEQAERRASIKQIMRDGRLSQLEKRRSIQCLMDGRSHNNARRSTIDCGQTNPYLQAKLAAEVRRREETIRRSSSFDNGRPEDGNPPPIEEGEDESMASLGRRESVASSVASLSRRGSAAESVDALSRRGTMESVVSFASARRGSVASQHTFASAGGGAAATSGTDLPMEDPPSFGSAPTSVFAAFNAGFTPPTLPDGGGPPEVPAPSDGFAAPWASFNGRSMNDSEHDRGLFAAAAATSIARSDRRREEGDDDGGDGGDDDDLGEYVHVPDHTPQVAAAIARATAETLTERLAAKHPYSATTTAVPAVAAGASEAYGAGMKGGEGRAAQRRTSSVDVCRRAIATAPPCTHYQRNCHIVSPCCGATFGCRICHDDCPVLPPPLDWAPPGGGMMDGVMADDAGGGGNGGRRYQRLQRTSSMPSSFSPSMGPPEHHNVDRFAIKEIICRECFTKQSSKSNFCVNCNVQFGEYHCAICNLWMSNEERPYHCPDCGFCRVGGGENFRHCKDCGMCIDKQLFADHNCKVGKYMSNCPVCQEDLFSSRDASHELPCGHAIHWHCFRELASHDSRCPMCKKTAETHERMKPTWDAMAMGIALQPVPPELSKVVTIKCNDCERVQEKRSWHFLGVQCRHCESFNTVVERITMIGQEAHEFLLRNNENGEDVGALTVGEQRRQEQAAQSQGSSGGGPGATQHAAANARATNGNPRARRRRRASMMAVPPSSGSTSATPPPPFG